MLEVVYFAVGAIVLLVIAVLTFVFRNAKVTDRLQAVDKYVRRQNKSYDQARQDRDKLKKKIERQNGGSILIEVIHDFGDSPQKRDDARAFIAFEEAMEIMNAVRSINKTGPITIILHTLGGFSLASEFIASAIKQHAGNTTVYVPYVAMSGGTMIALAADKIHLGKNAALGPVDTQYQGYSFEAFKKVYEAKREKTGDEVLINYFEFENREKTVRDRVRALTDEHHEPAAVDQLLNAKLPHDHRVTFDEAKKYGLNVSNECPNEIYEYVELRLTMIKKFEERGKSGQLGSDRAQASIESVLIEEGIQQNRTHQL